MSNSHLSDGEFRVLMNLAMVSDPWPLVDGESVINRLLNNEAEIRGYDGWYVAYHEFDP